MKMSLLPSIQLSCENSSAFNTVIPHRLSEKLLILGLTPSLYNWVLDFLTDRPRSVTVGNYTSVIRAVSTWTLGCVLSPMLYPLFTYEYVASQTNTRIIKFVDDTTVITGGEETAYRREVDCWPGGRKMTS